MTTNARWTVPFRHPLGFLPILAAFGFSGAFTRVLAQMVVLPSGTLNLAMAGLMVVLVAALMTPVRSVGSGKGWALIFLPGSGFALWSLLLSLFGEVSGQALIFHLRYDVVAVGPVLLRLLFEAGLALLPFVLMGACWRILYVSAPLLRRINGPVVLLLVLANPGIWTLVGSIGSPLLLAGPPSSLDLAQEYRDPLSAVAPQTPRNLLHIYLESAELALWDERRFGDNAAPLKALAGEAFQAVGIAQLPLTSWSIAGRVASGCGVPLFPLGAFKGNGFDAVQAILPRAACLSDILARDGYRNAYLGGAPLDFSGMRQFLAGHGVQVALGLTELASRYPGPYNDWGLEDDDLFDEALVQVRALAASGGPYSLTLSTLGGHAPQGYVAPACVGQPLVERQPNRTLAGFACSNLLLDRFLAQLRAEHLLNKTIVVIQSDHLAMRNEVYDALLAGERNNLLMILGPQVEPRVVVRPASQFSILPTVLEAMGYRLPEHRAGLGTSLMSPVSTLVERVGGDALERALDRDQTLRMRLWGLETPANGIVQ